MYYYKQEKSCGDRYNWSAGKAWFNLTEIRRKFMVEEVNRAKPSIINYDVPTSIPDNMVNKVIFKKN